MMGFFRTDAMSTSKQPKAATADGREGNETIHIWLVVWNIFFFPHTIWLFNIAMEKSPFIDDFPIKTSIYKGSSMAMLNNQRVIYGIILPIDELIFFKMVF